MADKENRLHKEVGSIFEGVPGSENGQENPQSNLAPEAEGKISSQTLVPSHLKPEKKSDLEKKGGDETQQDLPEQSEEIATAEPQSEKNAFFSGLKKYIEPITGKLLAEKPGVNPAKQKLMLILIPVLFIIMIFAFFTVLKSPARSASKAPKTNKSVSLGESSTEIKWSKPEKYSQDLRNPMEFGTSGTGQHGQGELVVKGILYSPENPSALVFDQIVREGDKILGATVVKINEDSVEFEKDGKKWNQKVQKYPD